MRLISPSSLRRHQRPRGVPPAPSPSFAYHSNFHIGLLSFPGRVTQPAHRTIWTDVQLFPLVPVINKSSRSFLEIIKHDFFFSFFFLQSQWEMKVKKRNFIHYFHFRPMKGVFHLWPPWNILHLFLPCVKDSCCDCLLVILTGKKKRETGNHFTEVEAMEEEEMFSWCGAVREEVSPSASNTSFHSYLLPFPALSGRRCSRYHRPQDSETDIGPSELRRDRERERELKCSSWCSSIHISGVE